MIKGNFLANNFLGLQEPDSQFEGSKVVVLPVPYERTVSFGRGTSRGPSSIIYASRSLELYDDELGFEPCKVGIHTLSELELDVEPKDMIRDVSRTCKSLLDADKFIVALGGEHLITYGVVAGHREKHCEFSVLSVDAHCDLRNFYEGTKLNHACVMRRIVETGCPVTQVGIRSYSSEEAEFIKVGERINVIHAREILREDSESWVERALSSLLPKVYISVDIDVFDPSIAPGTGTPEPGGLGWYEVLELIKSVFQSREVIGLDIVELAPIGGIVAPDVLAAKLAYKSIGYKFNNLS